MPILSFSETNFDADALTFINAASITDSTQQSAINTLVTTLKNYGLWDLLLAIYPFVGGTAFSHKFNLKNPLDSNVAFRITFYGGMNHSSLGIVPNASTAYGYTYINENLDLLSNDMSFGMYSQTNVSGLYIDMGLWGGTYGSQILTRYTDDYFYGYIQDASSSKIVNTDSKGFYLVNRTSSTVLKLQKNSIITTFTANSLGKSNAPLTISARWNNNISTTDLFSPRALSFAFAGKSLTDIQSTNLYTAVQAYQTTLGRQV